METNDSPAPDSDQIVLSRRELMAQRDRSAMQLAELDRQAEELRRQVAAYDAVLDLYPPARSDPGLTIREMAIRVLTEEGPMGVRAILDAIQSRFDVPVHRTSLSPILKKAERRGEVRHVGDKWEADAASAEA